MAASLNDSISCLVPALRAAVADLQAGFALLPLWAGLGILVLPVFCALLLRSLSAALAALAASTFALVVLDVTSMGSVAPLGFYVLSWIAALLAADRAREPGLARIEAKVSHVETQMIGFLQALDRRAEISENRTTPNASPS